ncbi:metallophosphoesterase [Phenylobacterium sp. J367]|uniref:metallophosphoesterase family protein n=1 Tax=Phenylobacterium sp. J367 TaxID=2898435 RepID=UPI0021517EB1|nr:metallophosphoesterase [Phenylobacterium sp. J367]MCR5880405.1 metallophosphoesterase [Phenylobacterium sp. J367]
MSQIRLAHFSDPHLAPPPMKLGLADAVSKRALSRIAWRRKSKVHRPEVLAALVADVKAHAPDHIVLTGDLTNFSTHEEYDQARAWLAGLGPAGDVTVSPGNHDALIDRRAGDPLAAWADWLGDEATGPFPRVRLRGPVALINLSSAVPTALHLAQGKLGAEQIARLAQVLRETRASGLYRLVLLHHPVAEGAVSRRKSLTDALELRAVLAAEGAELVLHGHAHESLVTRIAGPDGPIPVLGVPSASAAPGGHGEAARWHELAIARTEAGFTTRVSARGATADGEFAPLGAYRLRSARR